MCADRADKKGGRRKFVRRRPAEEGQPFALRRHLMMKMMKMMKMMMMTMMMTMMTGSGSQEVLVVRGDKVVQDLPPSGGSPLSPPLSRTAWHMLLNNSDVHKISRRRPKGPPGPQGLRGPPAPRPHPLQLIHNFPSTLSGASSEERPPPVSASFLGRLPRAVRVARRSLMELRPFSQALPPTPAFQRGRGFNISDGRYVATLSGFYLLSVRLRLKSGERVQVRPRASVRAAICVDSLCHANLAIESVVGVASVGGAFGITLTGTLFLKAGEYASVYVDNASGASISVLPDSFFCAVPLRS
ncbi:erythroferrone [Vanacampus margaritifer]